jgi:asparagine synthetase A
MNCFVIYTIYMMVHTIYIKQWCWGKILIPMDHNDNIHVINSINNVFIILNHCSIDIRFDTSRNISRTFQTNRYRSDRTDLIIF